MSFKQKLFLKTKIKPSFLPSSYHLIGDVLFLKLPRVKSLKQKKYVASKALEILHYAKTACEISYIYGEFRKPKIKLLVGKNTETIHKENGIFYKLDVSKIMFSKGNLSERKRLLGKIKKGEVIVDGFSGIGYFSLGLASKAKKIYAIEKNKAAFAYLKQNIKLNRINNIEPLNADFKTVKLPEKADRILMGYLPETYRFLPASFRLLKNKGIIHYHDTFSKKDLWEKPVSFLEKYADESGFKVKIIEKKVVKDYAPNVYHVVVDAEFRR